MFLICSGDNRYAVIDALKKPTSGSFPSVSLLKESFLGGFDRS